MKQFSDDEISKELKSLSQEFLPEVGQKERVLRKISQQKNARQSNFKLKNFLPILATIILFLSIIGSTFLLMVEQFAFSTENTSGKENEIINVTDAWNDIRFEQTSYQTGQNDLTNYWLVFENNSLTIIDNSKTAIDSDPDFKSDVDLDLYNEGKKALFLKSGKYEPYTVFKENDLYTIEVSGRDGFTFTLEKVAPRKFIGPDGIQFMTQSYLD